MSLLCADWERNENTNYDCEQAADSFGGIGVAGTDGFPNARLARGAQPGAGTPAGSLLAETISLIGPPDQSAISAADAAEQGCAAGLGDHRFGVAFA